MGLVRCMLIYLCAFLLRAAVSEQISRLEHSVSGLPTLRKERGVSASVDELRRVLEAVLTGSAANPSEERSIARQLEVVGRQRGLKDSEATALSEFVAQRQAWFTTISGSTEAHTADDAALKAEELKHKKKIKQFLVSDKERQEGLRDDKEALRQTPARKRPALPTAAEVGRDYPVREPSFERPVPSYDLHGLNPCSFKAADVQELEVWITGTREDGQAMHSFRTVSQGRAFALKVGRYVDLKREALIAARLHSCGSTSFAETCAILQMPDFLQDDGGTWRLPQPLGKWRSGARFDVPAKTHWRAIDIYTDTVDGISEDDLSACSDCRYWEKDPAGTYLKDGGFRAHIELCPRRCVVLQVQELVDGFTLEAFAMLYSRDYPRGLPKKEAEDRGFGKKVVRAAARSWLQLSNSTPEATSELPKVVTQLVQARLTAAYLEIHFTCGIIHDDMHVGNVLFRRQDGAVKIIDWELAPKPRLPFKPLATLSQRSSSSGMHPVFGRYTSNPMIGDRGTQCDSLFKNCCCNFPYEFVLPEEHTDGAYLDSYHCNLLGLPLDESWEAAASLARSISSSHYARSDETNEAFWGEPFSRIRTLLQPPASKLNLQPPAGAWVPGKTAKRKAAARQTRGPEL